ncbi:DEAD/DEAH box helicase [Oryzomonas sagensis]|uniref:DEAD/DEAH box helicase n=1 Tax=Oryzomonas sagensis TaxID=2603857 RepID=A0ABQ6TME7_9BACT|nr:DEAD/DEAH box helicase [Oryzomonas sagensis]KAB0669642.1 DEAD/DEAH box helicase [Oryzomonas sagensis]
MRFDELSIPEEVRQGIRDAGFSECTPIQEQTLPLTLSGKDVAGQAQTGTGKTAAFLITLFTRLLENKGTGTHQPRALILAPTRELVVQIEEDAQLLGRHCGLVTQAIYGGVDYMKQRSALREGADVIVGTPGRLIDYLKQKVYSLKGIEMLVIDEADRMFDMGFIADLRFILRRLPPYDKRQNLMFSATLSLRVMELAYEFMNMPQKLSVTPEKMTAERVEQVLYHVSRKEKFPLLLGLLRRTGMERTMIFINTKREAEYLFDRLNANGFPCRVISGDVEQRKRMRILDDFKQGKLPILIATDVASRGLHIEGVTHVINYDLPQDCEDYVHRIGRTARAGSTGKAISLADEDGAFFLEAIEEYIKDKIPTEWAEDELFVNDYVRTPRPKRKPLEAKTGGSRGRGGERTARPGRSGSVKPKPAAAAVLPSPAAATEGAAGEAPAKKRRRRRRKPGEKTEPGSAAAPQAE